jgi:thiol-disulfide isomerase/thioredoxin
MLLFAVLIGLTMPSAAAQDPARIAAFEFAAKTYGGQQIDHSDFKDCVLIVDLWGTWCGPCRAAAPALVSLYEQYKHHGLEIVGFSFTDAGGAEDAAVVRKFAAANRITWQLAPGDAAIQKQVPGFASYPTLLLFGRGLVHEATHVGFQDGDAAKIGTWVRKALGITEASQDKEAAQEQTEVEKEDVPRGKIFMPGKNDRGFAFAVRDVDGKDLTFESLRGKPVLVALTTTWDQEAVKTARLLQSLQARYEGLAVIAACIEKERDPARKTEAVLAFRNREQVRYRMFATETKFALDRVHRFAAMPTLLLFDGGGVLVLREAGLSANIEERLTAKVSELLR